MAILALVNASSGSVPEDAADRLEARLGRRLDREIACEGATLESALATIDAGEKDTLIVWGGDGSVAAALSATAGTGAVVLPLPGGTMNLLHKRVHGGPGDWESILDRALAAPEPRPLTYARAGTERIYVALMLGRLTHLAGAREALRGHAPLKAARHAVAAEALDLDTRLTARIGNDSQTATAAAAFLPESLDGDRLEIGLIDPDSLVDLAATGLSALVADWRTAEGIAFRLADTVRFDVPDGEDMDALLDGEPRKLPSPIDLTLHGGDVLVRSARGLP